MTKVSVKFSAALKSFLAKYLLSQHFQEWKGILIKYIDLYGRVQHPVV